MPVVGGTLVAGMAAEENAVFTALGLNQAEVPYLGTLDVNETEDELGRGSFAVVYKSKWCGLKVAAKALHFILIDRRNQGRDVVLHDFGAEIARMARLRHPHLCPIFGVGMVGTTPAIVVELMSDTHAVGCVPLYPEPAGPGTAPSPKAHRPRVIPPKPHCLASSRSTHIPVQAALDRRSPNPDHHDTTEGSCKPAPALHSPPAKEPAPAPTSTDTARRSP